MKPIHILAVLFCSVSAVAADTIKIQAALKRTAPESALVQALSDVTTQSGKEVTAVVDDHKLVILPTIVAGGSIRIEATFIEHASAAKPVVTKIPALTATSGKKSTIKAGPLSFDFTPTIHREQK